MSRTTPASDDDFYEPLTGREQEILALLAKGLKDREIALQLHLALKTVKWYNSQIYSKLGVNRRDEAVSAARRLSLLDHKEQWDVRHNLPVQITPFVGRKQQLAELLDLLNNQDTRLITILAPGGMGKTRLALEAARQQPGNFQDGIFFVALAPLNSEAHVISAIADVLELRLNQDEDPVERLRDHLRDKSLLLILDNFEHLLDAATIIREILQASPATRVLVTSREKLNLSGETVYIIGGMDFPEYQEATDVLAYEAAKLFQQHAERANSNFQLGSAQLGYLARICQLTGGMPLALELAAAWVNVLSLEDIAKEIQQSVDFLVVELRDMPQRQWSIRAVFEPTWNRLTPDEQDAYRKLTVFRGGFTRQAIEAVTGTNIHTILTLANKSLLRLEPGGRYQIHELLRQYAEHHLQTDVMETAATRDAHCTYFANFLLKRQPEIYGGDQKNAALDIETELENIRAMWDWAIAQVRFEEIQKSLHTFIYFCHQQSRFIEAAAILEKAAKSLKHHAERTEQLDFTLAEVLGHLGHFYLRLGLFEKSRATLEQSQAIYQSLDRSPTKEVAIVPETILGLLASISGDYKSATRLIERPLHEAEATGNHVLERVCNYFLMGVYSAQGDYEMAHRAGQKAYALVQSHGNRWFSAYILIELGKVARVLGDYDDAKQHFQASYSIREEFDDAAGMAEALNHLGSVMILEENYTEAQEIYRQTIAIYDKIGDRGGLAAALDGMGKVTLALGDLAEAEHYFYEALSVAGTQIIHVTFSVLIDLAILITKNRNLEQSISLLALALHHPNASREIRVRVEELLRQYESKLPDDLFTAATERGELIDLEHVVADLLSENGADP